MQRADHPVLEQLRKIYRDQMNELADSLAGGACHDFEQYKHITGIIEGYARAERELLDLDQRITEG